MPTAMPRDAHDNPVPALRYREDLYHERSGSTEDTADIIALNTDTKFVSIKTDGKIKVVFGDENALASSDDGHGFMGGEIEVIPLIEPVYGKQQYSHISIYFVDSATVYVSERE